MQHENCTAFSYEDLIWPGLELHLHLVNPTLRGTSVIPSEALWQILGLAAVASPVSATDQAKGDGFDL